MKSIFNTAYYVFISCIVLIALLLLATIVPIPGNIKAKIVKSGSMEPTIKTGDLVLIIPSNSYEVGDIITFGPDTKTQIPTTHRIVSVNGDGPFRIFETKGDANNAPDPTGTRLSEVSGKVFMSIPYLGFLLDFAKKPIGFILLIGVPSMFIIIDEIMKVFREIVLIKRKKNAALQQNKQPNN